HPMKSAVVIPVTLPGRFLCALAVGVFGTYRSWPDRLVEWLRLLSEILTSAVHRRSQEMALRQNRTEDASLTSRLEDSDRHPLAGQLSGVTRIDEIVGESPSLRSALARLQQVASTDSTVLLLGETGTGKELFAKALHARSPRRQFPLVSVNCAALPPTLI